MQEFSWLIWSMQHKMWWLPSSKGYTEDRYKAGRYSYEEAVKIVRGANYDPKSDPDEAMIRDESYCCAAPMINGGAQCESCGSRG